jgi:DNA replication and repair protein RecF
VYVDRLAPRFAETLQRLSPELSLLIDYQPGHEPGSLLSQLESETLREVKVGSTKYGPHRADLRIRALDRLAGSVLSRGQGKIGAFALRLAQAYDLREQVGTAPIFLVDDLGAELDRSHNERLFTALKSLDCQVLATTALDDMPYTRNSEHTTDWQMFHVEHGSVSAAESI